jgi:protein phosphatase
VTIDLPADAMVVLIGISGSGKSTFAAQNFATSQVLSSDAFRALVSDDEADQSATDDAFDVLHTALAARLRRGRLTVVDATNVKQWVRRELLDMAARYRRPAVAVVLDVPIEECLGRLAGRPIRPVPGGAVSAQARDLRRSLPHLSNEGFAAVYRLDAASITDATIRVIGDVARTLEHNEMSRKNRARSNDARSSDRHRNS